MAEKIRVLIQMKHTEAISMAASHRTTASAPNVEELAGFKLDAEFSPVKLPRKERRTDVQAREVGRIFSFNSQAEASTYLIRGEVDDEQALEQLSAAITLDPNGVGIYADPRISTFATCPSGPVGTHEDVSNQLRVQTLLNHGMDGSDVMVAIVDTGVNLAHLADRGMTPGFDQSLSWSPVSGSVLGDMPVEHGTMCAFDACIAAPKCTLLDFALLQSQTPGSTAMDGFLSDAVKAFSMMLDIMESDDAPRALVVNNSWGMFHSSWDFPVGHPGNYSDNPNHPFNIIVESLEDAGADILFAAGNCGRECADGRCQNETQHGIYGANSSTHVTCVAGVTIDDVRLGYSTQGPGHLDENKPDISAYTHFQGSGVYDADSGTSAACPVAAGLVAAVRSVYSSNELSPAQLRNLLRRSANDIGLQGFDYDHGFGVIDTTALISLLDRREIQPLEIGRTTAGSLTETGAVKSYQIHVGDAMTIALDGPQGADFDIYVRKDELPTPEDYDYRGYTNVADEKIRIDSVTPGDYYVLVRSYRGSGDFTLQTNLE